ncbi:MAG: hypothetical protein WBH77_07025 [Saccharofermentanales bacterium]
MKLTLEEQETTINIMRNAYKAEVYSSDQIMIKKLNKLLKAEGTEWELVKLYEDAIIVEAPKNLIQFRSRTAKRNLTNEQRKQLGKRLSEARKEAKQKIR